MIMEQQPNVESNIQNAKAFTIENSREAFAILSEKLYSNKIEAVMKNCQENPVRLRRG